ncbi:MAG: PLDc N-terminal domain-containing protein, partial [Proteobacteria bacterium]|nr:PLDc N-terminal domain-containing protein [Pseudomonadota bacterium]
HAALRKRDPRAAAMWMAISIFIPFAGALSYWVFGINRLKRPTAFPARKRSRRRGLKHRTPHPAILPPGTPPGVSAMEGISRRVTGRPLVPANRIVPLYEGNEAFPAMLTAIGAARKSINMSTYILDKDAVGQRTIAALCAAAREGVQVRVLIDGVGTDRSAIAMARKLREAGAKLAVFHPLFGLPFRKPSINLRNHRKLLVVDGKVGFTGGLNITSRHFFTRLKKKPPVRDIHFRVEGPILLQMQEIFAMDWQASRGEVLEGEDFFPQPDHPGVDLIRAVPSGPDEDLEHIYEIVLGALRSARNHVLIMTPYFIPDRVIMQTMKSAVLAGISVSLFLPKKGDHPIVQWASNTYLPELLKSGVRIVLIPPPFVHSKLMLMDDAWSLIGSANLDPRSFRLNFEFDLEVFSPDLTIELRNYAERLAAAGTLLKPGMLEGRPLGVRLLEGVVRIFSPFL